MTDQINAGLEPVDKNIEEIKEELKQLKELLKDNPLTTRHTSVMDEARSKIKAEESAKELAREELISEQFINNFDNEYGKLIEKSNLEVINLANTTNQHKVVEKFCSIFSNKNNFDILPSILLAKTNDILALNETERAGCKKINEIQEILANFVEIKTKLDVKKNIFNNVPEEIETIANKRWQEHLKLSDEKSNNLKKYL